MTDITSLSNITDILNRILQITERVQNMEILSTVAMGVFGILLIFGLLNCILGYRLLRFWMMLGGFFVGAGLGFLGLRTMAVEQTSMYLVVMIGAGIALALISFLIYKAGIFVLGAGIGGTLSVYLLHPTSSAVFFVCILIGVAVGALGVKYSKGVIIVSTSIIGGIMAGVSIAKLGSLAEIPYGVGMSAGIAVLGILIQFAINKGSDEDEDDEDDVSYEQRRNAYAGTGGNRGHSSERGKYGTNIQDQYDYDDYNEAVDESYKKASYKEDAAGRRSNRRGASASAGRENGARTSVGNSVAEEKTIRVDQIKRKNRNQK